MRQPKLYARASMWWGKLSYSDRNALRELYNKPVPAIHGNLQNVVTMYLLAGEDGLRK